MKCGLTIVMTLLLTCSLSHARLGETPQQVETRYGKPLDGSLVPSGPMYSTYGDQMGRYSKDVYRISIIFNAGTSVYESFQKTDLYGIAALTKQDVDYFLGANAASSAWTKEKEGFRWKRDDGAATASINADRTVLVVHLVQAARTGM